MKKRYIQPTIEVVEIKAKLTLLVDSLGLNSEQVNEEDEL